jgi:hypothetical protein
MPVTMSATMPTASAYDVMDARWFGYDTLDGDLHELRQAVQRSRKPVPTTHPADPDDVFLHDLSDEDIHEGRRATGLGEPGEHRWCLNDPISDFSDRHDRCGTDPDLLPPPPPRTALQYATMYPTPAGLLPPPTPRRVSMNAAALPPPPLRTACKSGSYPSFPPHLRQGSAVSARGQAMQEEVHAPAQNESAELYGEHLEHLQPYSKDVSEHDGVAHGGEGPGRTKMSLLQKKLSSQHKHDARVKMAAGNVFSPEEVARLVTALRAGTLKSQARIFVESRKGARGARRWVREVANNFGIKCTASKPRLGNTGRWLTLVLSGLPCAMNANEEHMLSEMAHAAVPLIPLAEPPAMDVELMEPLSAGKQKTTKKKKKKNKKKTQQQSCTSSKKTPCPRLCPGTDLASTMPITFVAGTPLGGDSGCLKTAPAKVPAAVPASLQGVRSSVEGESVAEEGMRESACSTANDVAQGRSRNKGLGANTQERSTMASMHSIHETLPLSAECGCKASNNVMEAGLGGVHSVAECMAAKEASSTAASLQQASSSDCALKVSGLALMGASVDGTWESCGLHNMSDAREDRAREGMRSGRCGASTSTLAEVFSRGSSLERRHGVDSSGCRGEEPSGTFDEKCRFGPSPPRAPLASCTGGQSEEADGIVDLTQDSEVTAAEADAAELSMQAEKLAVEDETSNMPDQAFWNATDNSPLFDLEIPGFSLGRAAANVGSSAAYRQVSRNSCMLCTRE